MTNDKEKITKCGQRLRNINDKLTNAEKIGKLNREDLIKRIEFATNIRYMWNNFLTDQLIHLNTVLLSQSIKHDMSIAMCKCAKDLEISIPENIESPNQFHKHILEQIKLKR